MLTEKFPIFSKKCIHLLFFSGKNCKENPKQTYMLKWLILTLLDSKNDVGNDFLNDTP